MAQTVCTVFDRGCFHCAKSQRIGMENKKTKVSKMVYHYPEIGSLFIQETTTQVEKTPKEFPKKAIKAYNAVEAPIIGKQTPNFDLENEQPGKLKHCWSGITFIDEKYERERDNAYRANLKIALANRRRWIRMHRVVENQLMSSQIEKCGPDWYQDLSFKQLTLLESFPDVLKRDNEEKSVSNIRKFLKDMGIVPSLGNNFLRDLIESCKRDPMYFFDQIRREIRRKENQRQLDLRNEKDPISDVEISKRKYTVSERILFSAMLTIHLPLLLFKLHLILPQVPLESKTRNILSPLPGELVSSLPDPKKKWFKSQKADTIKFGNFDEPFGMSVPRTLKDEQQSSDEVADSSDDLSSKFKTHSIDLEPIPKLVDASVQTETSASESELTTHPIQNDLMDGKNSKIPEKNEILNVEKKRASTSVSASGSVQENEGNGSMTESKRSSMSGSNDSSNDDQIDLITLTPDTDYEKVIAIMMASIVRVPTEDENYKRQKVKDCLKNYDIEGLCKIFGMHPPQEKKENNEEKSKKTGKSNNTKKLANDLTTGNDQNMSSVEASAESNETKPNSTEAGLEKLICQLREAIAHQPKKKQLKYALSVVANAGDPLASFPGIHQNQTIIRWYEIRTGTTKKLTDNDREKLIWNSRRAWILLMSNRTPIASHKFPRFILTSKELANYTWDRKKWAMNKINSAINTHKRNIRQVMVDDARLLYNTMSDLDYDSKLNQNIRETFFTYLPAAETECYI